MASFNESFSFSRSETNDRSQKSDTASLCTTPVTLRRLRKAQKENSLAANVIKLEQLNQRTYIISDIRVKYIFLGLRQQHRCQVGYPTLCPLSPCPRSLCLGHFVPVTLSPGHFVSCHFVPGNFVPWSLCLGHFVPVTLSPGHFVSCHFVPWSLCLLSLCPR
jgi:hypothetical protein